MKLEPECEQFYRASMEALREARVPFLVGGAYAFGVFTGIERDTKDFDLFLKPDDRDRALDALTAAGYEAERTFPHWLAKAKCGQNCIDLIYRAGNGLCEVDESWFARARDGELLGVRVRLCAPEEILWMKAYIMERERYDGADVAHLLESCADTIDWQHLLRRFDSDWRVLLSHFILFGYIFPSERDRIPATVMDQLLQRVRAENADLERICRGTMISREQYLRDVSERGFRDARLDERVRMSEQDIANWTAAISEDHTPQK